MARFVGVLKCKGGWGMAEVDVLRQQRKIQLSLARSFPRSRRIASPTAAPPCLPEDCYAALQGGRPVPAPRRTVLGRKERWKLLQVAYPGLPVPTAPRGMSDADVLDALVLAWAAQEIAAGRFTQTPAGDVIPGRFRLMR